MDDALRALRGCRPVDLGLAVDTVVWLKGELSRLRKDKGRRDREARLARSARRRKPELRWVGLGLTDGSVAFVMEADPGRSHWSFDPQAGNPEMNLRSWANHQLQAARVSRTTTTSPGIRSTVGPLYSRNVHAPGRSSSTTSQVMPGLIGT